MLWSDDMSEWMLMCTQSVCHMLLPRCINPRFLANLLHYFAAVLCVQGALQHIPAMLESLAVCGRFPEASCNYALTAQDATEAVAAEEETATVLEKRQDLFTLFKNTAKLVPDLSYVFVSKQLQGIMSRQKAEWQVRLVPRSMLINFTRSVTGWHMCLWEPSFFVYTLIGMVCLRMLY